MTESKYLKQALLLAKLTIILLILGDLGRKTALFFDLSFTRYTAVVKILLLVLYGVFFVIHAKTYINCKPQRQLLYVILGFCGLFFLSNIFPFNYSSFNTQNTEFLVKYIFFPFTFLIFYKVLINQETSSKLFKFYEYFFLFNLIIIVISFLFDIELFKSYHHPRRFGYSGLINRSNQMSYISIMMILIYYYKNQILKHKNHIIFFATIFISLLVGTKRIYFFLIFLLLFHLYRIRKSYNYKSLLAFLGAGTILFLLKGKISELFISKFGLFITIYERNGFWASLLSYRNENLAKTFNEQISPNWDVFNFLFGGIDFTIIRPEMDVIDIFFFFGLFGLVLYFVFIKLLLKTLNSRNKFIRFTLLIMLLIAFISSGLINSTNIPFIFFITLFYLNQLTLIDRSNNLNTSG